MDYCGWIESNGLTNWYNSIRDYWLLLSSPWCHRPKSSKSAVQKRPLRHFWKTKIWINFEFCSFVAQIYNSNLGTHPWQWCHDTGKGQFLICLKLTHWFHLFEQAMMCFFLTACLKKHWDVSPLLLIFCLCSSPNIQMRVKGKPE